MIPLLFFAVACGGSRDEHAPAVVALPPSAPIAVGVGGEPQPEVGARRLAVVARLHERTDPSDGPIVDSRCLVGGELRPALGCTRMRAVAERKLERAGPDQPAVIPISPAPGPPRPRMVEWSVRAPGNMFEVRRPPTVLAANAPFLQAHLAEVAGADAAAGTRLMLRARTMLPERVRTLRVDVPPASRLEFGLAIDPAMPRDGVEAVVFALSAETPAGERPLFESRLAVDDPAAGRWTDHRIALDEIAGPGVRFVFTTRLMLREGARPALAAALPLWGAPEILAPSDDPALDVIVISFDTLRADHVGAYGSTLPTTPHLDRLAAEGLVFDDVFATYPATSASHMSMLTGMYPVKHGVLIAEPLRANVATLAMLLGARGWRTGAVTENGMVRADGGFAKGVSFYRENKQVEDVGKESRAATDTFDAAARWIAAHAHERFFLFIHTYVVHWPYEPPAEFDVFRDETAPPPAPGKRDLETLRRRYAAEARYGDALFAGLRDELTRLGLANRTLVVVTSDHGEEFGEHGGWSHANTLYDEVMRVPFIFWAPKSLGPPRRSPGPASLVDLLPTVLDVLDLPIPAGLDGQSLLAEKDGSTNRVVFAEMVRDNGRRVMARTRDAKWVWNHSDRSLVEAFDLRADPGERQAITDPAFQARGAPFLADYLARAPGSAPGAVPAAATKPADQPADPAMVEKLRALGYVQ